MHLLMSTKQRAFTNFQIRICLRFHKIHPWLLQLLMTDVPSARVTSSSPFTHGIDFPVPFFLKRSWNRNFSVVKCYFCVFVYSATKAVHVELVTYLPTDKFIELQGLPEITYSDCGSNFIDTAGYVKYVTRFLQLLSDFFVKEHTCNIFCILYLCWGVGCSF